MTMKKIAYLLIATSFIMACSGESKKPGSDNLEAERLRLISQIDSLTQELKAIEATLALQDTFKILPIVTVLPLESDIFKHYVEVQGVVQADKNVILRPELGGTVQQILVKEGQRVSAGQLLVQLNDDLIQKSMDELETQLSLARTTFERQDRLWAQNIGSEMQYLQAKTQLESLERSKESLKSQAAKMKITATFNGVVDEIFPKTGELTSPQTPVVRLINLNDVYVESDVTETYLTVVEKGTEALLHFPSINSEVEASISQVGNFINPENRSFKVRMNLKNPDGSIKPNLLANVRLLDFEAEGISIPVQLVQQDQFGADYVFIIRSENGESRVEKQLVTVGLEYDNKVFISDGLTVKDTLVNAGARLIKAGDKVRINETL
jgi:RND family efflux transporter MFP subunit